MKPALQKSILAAAVAGTFAMAAIPPAQANVINMSWEGAFTFLNPSGTPVSNSPSDYANGFYGVTGTSSGPATTHGWFGHRTPITGTMSFDTNSGAGVGTINPFLFLGNGNNNYLTVLGFSFQSIDTAGTLVGGLLYSWNLASHQVSMVLDASGLFSALSSGPTSTIAGVGSLPASDGADFDSSAGTLFLPLGPSPVATTTINTAGDPYGYGPAGCDGLTLATQVNAYTINANSTNLAICMNAADGFGVDDGVGGDPMTSTATGGFNMNIDVLSVHIDSVSAIPVPPAIWLFGSGLLGLLGLARRKRPD